MVSLRRAITATSSATIRLSTFVFLRWIPGHHFVPIVLSSLVVYLSSLFLFNDQPIDRAKNTKGSRTKSAKTEKSSSGSSALKTLLTGVPSKRSSLWTWITALINVFLALLAFDFLLRGFLVYSAADVAFSRIGYVSPTTANLLFREPNTAHLPVVVSYQEVSADSEWIEEGTHRLYHNCDSEAAQAFNPVQILAVQQQDWHFFHFPQPGSLEANRLTFATTSCLKPNFPYDLFSHPLRVHGIEQMTEVFGKLPALLRPAFMLFLGDFIYIDVPFRFGSSLDHYRSEYRRIYSSPSWMAKAAGGTAIDLPWIHTLDDHEIENDWSKGNKTAPYPAAADPFIHYHVSANPPVPANSYADPDDVTYFSFVNGPASFFMLDTRTYRSEPSQKDSSILGYAQLQSLLTYLATPEPEGVRWKFIASSVPFTKNWRVGTKDTWGGFLNERRTVFEAMWRAERELGVRIVLLSGDRHEFAASRFPDPSIALSKNEFQPNTAGHGLHEFSVGPLSMFYLPIRTYHQTDSEDVAVKYAPDGNSKFGLIEIVDGVDDDHSRSSLLTYSLYVDGEAVWQYRLSVPIEAAANSAKHYLPPGRVLEDKLSSQGWNLVFESEVANQVVNKVTNWYYDVLDRVTGVVD
ncbi:hypothetical protein N7495_006274 [Penicillium taxi]|uniref:uncharacterized protein n=1 Tax=Penicillium taxi TaxID=168475 RepID=UPI0025450CA8|nr:uncharacterized protein N7495_006274 [Penicillium taxi]KAJ5894583.1 hypothetical protein N7495_006274 [Penicillium taxi]